MRKLKEKLGHYYQLLAESENPEEVLIYFNTSLEVEVREKRAVIPPLKEEIEGVEDSPSP